MNSNTQVFLSKVVYSADKRQIIVDFSSTNEKFSRRFSFFPKMFFSLGKIPQNSFLELLSKDDFQKLKVSFANGKATIFGATFNDLKRTNNLLREFFNFECNLIEPERQFLIEKSWSYFDCFELKENNLELISSSKFPNVKFEFLSDSLKETVNDLLKNNRRLASEIVQKIVSSKLLKIPFIENENSKPLVEIFLENIFFESNVPLTIGKTINVTYKKRVKGRTQIDFSKLVSVMASKPFNNIGFETMNCDCCKPISVDMPNVLPSSSVKVKFLREGIYFNSVSNSWSNDYHKNHSMKDSREQRKTEYYFDRYPAGPFFKNQEEEIILADALKLLDQNLISISNEYSLEWYCLEKESVFSKQITFLSKTLSSLSIAIERESALMVSTRGLFYSQEMDSDPGFFYRKTLEKNISKLLSDIPNHLMHENSRFYDKKISIGFETLLGVIFKDFGEVVENTSNARVSFSYSRALVDSHSILSVSKKFAELYNIDKQFLSLKTA